MKNINNNPETVTCTEKKSASLLVTTGSVTEVEVASTESRQMYIF
jgi:hypothetical protein